MDKEILNTIAEADLETLSQVTEEEYYDNLTWGMEVYAEICVENGASSPF